MYCAHCWSSCTVLTVGLHVLCSLFLLRFRETWIFWIDLRQFHKNLSSGSRVVPYGRKNGRTNRQTERHDEANSRFPQFCEKRPKNSKGNQLGAYASPTVQPTSLFIYAFPNYAAQCFHARIFQDISCWCWNMTMINWTLCIFSCINSNAIKTAFRISALRPFSVTTPKHCNSALLHDQHNSSRRDAQCDILIATPLSSFVYSVHISDQSHLVRHFIKIQSLKSLN